MRIIFIVFGICFFFFSTSNAQNSNITIQNYDIEVFLSESEKSLIVNLLCNISTDENINSLQLLLNPAINLNSVSCLSHNEWRKISFAFNGNDSLLLKADEKSWFGKNTKLRFEYSLPVETLNDTVLLLDRGHRWYPLIVDQVFTYILKCNVPEKYKVFTSGKLQDVINVNGNSIFVWSCDKPVFKLPLIIYNPDMYKKLEVTSSNNNIGFYSMTIDSAGSKNIIQQVDAILSYFNKTIGSYGRDKLTYFEVADFQGINVGSGLLTTGTEALEQIGRKYRDALILTIAQQWFGAGVFPDFNQKGFFFFSISLPHYLRLMYVRDSDGEEAFNNSMSEPIKRYEEFAGSERDTPVIDVDIPNSKEKSIILYVKGPFILSKIENEMGRENWKSFLADLYLSFCGKIMTYDDFTLYMKKYDNTERALILFEKLMSEKGMPEKL